MAQQNPMVNDCYLQGAAHDMVAEAQINQAVLPVLKKRCPQICRQIAADARYPDLLAQWGRSCNLDENAGQIIVHPAILEAIGTLARVPMRGRFVHAGLEHTYGYLFSLIETPYGRKRDRWVTADLETGFGLDPTLLGDRPNAGTLLGNLTWFLSRIVGLPLERRAPPTVAPEIFHLDYSHLRRTRVVERMLLAKRNGREVVAFIDLIPFPRRPVSGAGNGTLLIYSLQTSARAPLKLITAFPVNRQTVADLIDSARSRKKVRMRLRYNAYVPGLFGQETWGARELIEGRVQN